MEGKDAQLCFSELSEAEQAAVRDAQKRRKLAKAKAKEAKQLGRAEANMEQPQQQSPPLEIATKHGTAATLGQAGDLLAAVAAYPTRISLENYFGACPGGRFRDPNLPPTDKSLALLMTVLQARDEQAQSLNTCNYFQFSGPPAAVWDATFNARLAWEGFFTITTESRGRGAAAGDREPLPELQPYYGVLTWSNFHAAKHVRKHLRRMRRDLSATPGVGQSDESDGAFSKCAQTSTWRRLYLEDNADRSACWQHLEDYHNSPTRAAHGNNWLTKKYFEMMVAASDDPSNSFRMHTVLMVEEVVEEPDIAEDDGETGETTGGATGEAEGADTNETSAARVVRRTPLAGEIGFTVGQVYTSLSGWTGERSTEAHGTSQLVLLALWLEKRGYAFWSLGHCYSPELDYKRALGHRILPRWDFIRLLRQYRGSFIALDASKKSPRVCARCGVEEASVGAHKACSRCGVVFYCGRECQTAHWKKKGGDHKTHCVPKPQLTSGADTQYAPKLADDFLVLEPGQRCGSDFHSLLC